MLFFVSLALQGGGPSCGGAILNRPTMPCAARDASLLAIEGKLPGAYHLEIRVRQIPKHTPIPASMLNRLLTPAETLFLEEQTGGPFSRELKPTILGTIEIRHFDDAAEEFDASVKGDERLN
jgi:hypothetical protein